MKILALDMATRTGWALYNDGEVMSGVINLADKNKKGSHGELFIRFNHHLANLAFKAQDEIDLIVYEQAHFRGGAATRLCVGLATCVLVYAAKYFIRTESVHTATLKKWATGKGNADKGDMIRAACVLGYQPQDDNEADALMLLEYTLRKEGVTK